MLKVRFLGVALEKRRTFRFLSPFSLLVRPVAKLASAHRQTTNVRDACDRPFVHPVAGMAVLGTPAGTPAGPNARVVADLAKTCSQVEVTSTAGTMATVSPTTETDRRTRRHPGRPAVEETTTMAEAARHTKTFLTAVQVPIRLAFHIAVLPGVRQGRQDDRQDAVAITSQTTVPATVEVTDTAPAARPPATSLVAATAVPEVVQVPEATPETGLGLLQVEEANLPLAVVVAKVARQETVTAFRRVVGPVPAYLDIVEANIEETAARRVHRRLRRGPGVLVEVQTTVLASATPTRPATCGMVLRRANVAEVVALRPVVQGVGQAVATDTTTKAEGVGPEEAMKEVLATLALPIRLPADTALLGPLGRPTRPGHATATTATTSAVGATSMGQGLEVGTTTAKETLQAARTNTSLPEILLHTKARPGLVRPTTPGIAGVLEGPRQVTPAVPRATPDRVRQDVADEEVEGVRPEAEGRLVLADAFVDRRQAKAVGRRLARPRPMGHAKGLPVAGVVVLRQGGRLVVRHAVEVARPRRGLAVPVPVVVTAKTVVRTPALVDPTAQVTVTGRRLGPTGRLARPRLVTQGEEETNVFPTRVVAPVLDSKSAKLAFCYF